MFARLVTAAALVMGLLAAPMISPGGSGTAGVEAARPARYLVSLAARSAGGDLAIANAARVREARPILDLLKEQGVIAGYTTVPGDGTAVVEGTRASLRRLRAAFGVDVAPLSPVSGRAHAAKLRALAAQAGVAAGAGDLTGDYSIGGSYVSGTAPANAFVEGTLLDSSGNVIARHRAKSDEGGSYSLSFVASTYPGFFPGFTIRLKAGASSLVLKVPVLSASGNRATDVISGKGPRNAALVVTATHYIHGPSGSTSSQFPLAVLTNGQGSFSQDFTPFVNLIGADGISIKYTYPETANDVTYSTDFPYIYGYIDRTDVGGAAAPGTHTIVVRNRAGKQIFSMPVKAEWDGDWDDDLVTATAAVAIRPLMTLVLSDLQGVSMKVPSVTAKLNRAAKTVSGRGPAGTPFLLNELEPYQSYTGVIGEDGRYVVDISSAGPIKVQTHGYVLLYLPSGDYVYRIW